MTQKGEVVERLQVKASAIGRILTNLERKYNNNHEKDDRRDMKKSPSGQSLSKRAPANRIQEIPPFDANKIRKSPSTEATSSAAAAQEDNLTSVVEE